MLGQKNFKAYQTKEKLTTMTRLSLSDLATFDILFVFKIKIFFY